MTFMKAKLEWVLLAVLLVFAAYVHQSARLVPYDSHGDNGSEVSDTRYALDPSIAFDPGFKSVNELRNSRYQPLQGMVYAWMGENFIFKNRAIVPMTLFYLMHLFNILIVYRIARGLFGKAVPALVSAFYFSIHRSVIPVTRYWCGGIHVVSVTAVLVFFLVFLEYFKTGKKRYYAVTLAAYAPMLLLKETTVYFLILAGLYDWVFRSPAGSLKQRLAAFFSRVHIYYPFLLITLLHTAVTKIYTFYDSVHLYHRRGDVWDPRWVLPRMFDHVVFGWWPGIQYPYEAVAAKMTIALGFLAFLYWALRHGSPQVRFAFMAAGAYLFLGSTYLSPPVTELTRRLYVPLPFYAMAVTGIAWDPRLGKAAAWCLKAGLFVYLIVYVCMPLRILGVLS